MSTPIKDATTYTKSYSGKGFYDENPLAFITVKVGDEEIVRVPASLLKELVRDLLEVDGWDAPLKATDEYNFALLKKCHEVLGMKEDQSYSLIPGEIEEWLCSHAMLKAKEVKATDRAIMLQLELAKRGA